MSKYQEMYKTLFRAHTKAIDILQEAQREAEEIYLSAPEPDLTVLHPVEPESEDEEEDPT